MKFFYLILFKIILSTISCYEGYQKLDYSEANWPQICKIGTRQSPIDLDVSKSQIIKDNSILNILFNDYRTIKAGNLTLYENHNFGYNLDGTDSLWISRRGVPYQYFLLGFHIHIDSEHTISGKTYDLELHLVHGKNKNYLSSRNITDEDTNDYLVVGTFFQSDSNSTNNKLLESMNWESRSTFTNLNLSPLAQPTMNYFHYSGSLTTPDCVEKVNWIVNEKVQTMSVQQIKTIKDWVNKYYPAGNSRTVQSSKDRTIYYIQNSNSNSLRYSLIALSLFILMLF